MSRYKYSKVEQEINSVLLHQSNELASINRPDMTGVDEQIKETEALLRSIGIDPRYRPSVPKDAIAHKSVMAVPSWNRLCEEAILDVGSEGTLESLFTDEEIKNNDFAIRQLNKEYSAIHKLDAVDISISAVAAILGGVIDILLVGIPVKTTEGLKAGALSNYVRQWFEKRYPREEMDKLAQSKESKVPYDAQDNRHTTEYVTGLSAYYHRLLSLGHDPLLGFLFGVLDILNGTMTTIDKNGKFVVQVMENYADRTESDIFTAIAKQILHRKTDINTSMGLPVPLMALFNLLQCGSIGEEEQTIAEIVQGMYYQGYDFKHFCAMSIPTMITEVFVRLAYGIKRLKEGHSIKESIPFSLDREKHPKLATMVFVAHSGATAINAGKVYFTGNPMAINYPQWIAFAKYSYSQLKWVLIKKPELRNKYVCGIITEELSSVYKEIDDTFGDFAQEYTVIFEQCS